MTALDWQSVNDVVEFPVTSSGETFYLTDGGYTHQARGLRAGPGFLEGLGVRVVLGRSLTQDDFSGALERATLIGHALWRDRFGSDPGVVGRILRADIESQPAQTETLRIVGVLPADFYYGRDSREKVNLLVPLTTRVRTYMLRLREGVPVAAAERRITEAARSVASELPLDWSGVHLESVHGRYVGQLRPVLAGVTVAVGLVLVLVCANVAVLLVLRTMRRQKELAVRVALGSARRHLGRMLMVETTLLCASAVAAGLALTHVSLGALAPLVESQLGRAAPGGTTAIAVDRVVVLLVASIALLIAWSLAFIPLLMPWQRRLGHILRQDGRTAPDTASMRRLRGSLIAFEIAGSLVLLVSCGLMIRSLLGMVRSDLGFHTEGLVRTRVVVPARNYPDAPAFRRFYEQLSDRLTVVASSPVVFTSWPPFSQTPKQSIETESGGGVAAGMLMVSAGYFPMLGIEVRQGRGFTAEDTRAVDPVAIISETLSRRLWPDGSAIGRRMRNVVETPGGPVPAVWRTVVGIAGDVRQTYADTDLHDLYIPYSPEGRFGTFYMRTDRPPASLIPHLRAAVAELDSRAVINEPRSVDSENAYLAGTRFLTSLLSGFAAIAAFLAILGIYGVTAYTVQQRLRELAIRMALGATERSVLQLFLKDGSRLLAAGIGAGLIVAVPVARALQNQVHGVRWFDPVTLAATCALLIAAGMVATWWPVTRAAARSPLNTLKEG